MKILPCHPVSHTLVEGQTLMYFSLDSAIVTAFYATV